MILLKNVKSYTHTHNIKKMVYIGLVLGKKK